jgi:mono/diheme cytochrome c family protein
MQCHLASGKGDSKNFPPLDGSDWLIKKENQSIHAIKYGQTGEILVNGKKFNSAMPAMGLSSQEVADVMNYIRNSWSNKNSKMISLEQVQAVKQ